MLRSKFIIGIALAILSCVSSTLVAQPVWTIEPFGKEKKPEKYEDKKLASEKTGEKSFGPVRRALQNTTSHFNFYFNANNKINEVIERAKMANKDDYSRFLSFYPYSLENTSTQKNDLDSVITKATAGILLHDLRSEWVDNFYLLIGKSYFLKKDYDSAAMTFQFINYNLFPRSKKDYDDSKVVGTNDAGTGLGSVSIADKEKRNILQKTFTLPPSRNDALIWLTKTFIEQEEYGDAAGMISILQNDKNLPSRLKNDLEEVTSYWFYAQNNYDSSAVHLENALTNADNKQDKSRWEYLLAQMYERTGKFDEASTYYAKAAKHTADPVMDIYARLNDAKMMRNTGNFKELDNSIANLLKMAKKDRYESYRDVIYYSAAQLTLQRPDTTVGVGLYGKSIAYNNPTSGYRDKSFLQLANISYSQKNYKDARSFYDSLTLTGKDTDFDPKAIEERKEILGRLIPKILAIEREDSLQKIAGLPAAERDVIIKKMVRQYRKANGLKADEEFAGQTIITNIGAGKTDVPDLFDAKSNKSGWYFDNASLRSKGFNEFQSRWGKRSNVDNWRRKNASENLVKGSGNLNTNIDIDATVQQDSKGLPIATKPVEFTYDALLADVPLTKDRIDSSNISIGGYMLGAAQIFQNELPDYERAIDMYEEYLRRFPQDAAVPDAYLGLAYSWAKLGNESKAALYRNTLTGKYGSSEAARVVLDPASVNPQKNNQPATARYQNIYNMFVEGNFAAALAEKKKADSSYGKNYWTPQLLYIESVYYIKERQDSSAIASLKNIIGLYPKTTLANKATVMIDVLGRRAEIENYLTNLQVTRVEDDKILIADIKPDAKVVAPATVVVPVIKAPVPVIKSTVDSVKTPQILVNKTFRLEPDQPQFVAMILDKVDGVYVNEARNAFTRFNKSSMATLPVTINRDAIDADKALLLFAPFENAEAAIKYYDKIKKAAPSEVSWLTPAKYSFIIISDANLQVLKTNRDLASYRQLLNSNFGNKF